MKDTRNKTSVLLTPEEIAHLENYRCLDDIDKARVNERMETLLESDKYNKKDITFAG